MPQPCGHVCHACACACVCAGESDKKRQRLKNIQRSVVKIHEAHASNSTLRALAPTLFLYPSSPASALALSLSGLGAFAWQCGKKLSLCRGAFLTQLGGFWRQDTAPQSKSKSKSETKRNETKRKISSNLIALNQRCSRQRNSLPHSLPPKEKGTCIARLSPHKQR